MAFLREYGEEVPNELMYATRNQKKSWSKRENSFRGRMVTGKRGLTHQIITGDDVGSMEIIDRKISSVLADYKNKSTRTETNDLSYVSVGVQSMSLCRKVDRMLYKINA